MPEFNKVGSDNVVIGGDKEMSTYCLIYTESLAVFLKMNLIKVFGFNRDKKIYLVFFSDKKIWER